jgi:hypothetical protein
MSRHPNNGPTFSKSTIKQKPFATPSSDRRKAQQDDIARHAASQRRSRKLFNTDLAAWLDELSRKSE